MKRNYQKVVRGFDPKDRESLKRFNAAIEKLEPRDGVEHNYLLTNETVRILILICVEKGDLSDNQQFLNLAAVILCLLIAHEPELEPDLRELLDSIGIEVNDKTP